MTREEIDMSVNLKQGEVSNKMKLMQGDIVLNACFKQKLKSCK